MHYSTTLIFAAAAGLAAAQRPANISICDYYTTALLKENTPQNQLTVLTLVVNTAVIGNHTSPNATVPGILTPGMFNGTMVNLLPYFDGTLKSSNRGGSSGVSINFLDDGGAAPLMKSMPSNGNQTSNQYMLLTHLYQYFGVLLGCSGVGKTGYPSYSGATSMYNAHKFMKLNPHEMGYFITQVGLSAASFGVTPDDVAAVGTALNKAFNYRCAPAAAVTPNSQPELQSICTDSNCPLAANATCAAYTNTTSPAFVNGTSYTPSGSSNSSNSLSSSGGSGSAGGTGSGAKSLGSHSSIPASLAALALGIAAFTIFLT